MARNNIARIATAIVFLLFLSACAGYSLVEGKRQTIAGVYTVDPQIAWSKPQTLITTGGEAWTIDGSALDEILFLSGFEDGDTLFDPGLLSFMKVSEDRKLPAYRAGMTANEMMEFVVDTFSRMGYNNVKAKKLRPARFGSATGFRFDLAFKTSEGLNMAGSIQGAVIKDKMYLILYTGTRAYYYPKYKKAVDRLLASIRLIS